MFLPDAAQCQLPKDTPLCPLDDRYADKVNELRTILTEPALIRARLAVEVHYLIALSREEGVPELPSVDHDTRQTLLSFVDNFNPTSVARVRYIERAINHDVKAVEYYLRELIEQFKLPIPAQFVHFGLTSEDVTNTAYGLIIHQALNQVIFPQHTDFTDRLSQFFSEHPEGLLGMTHGQPATPTSIDEQLQVFVARLQMQLADLKKFTMHGKFSGAVGNFSAHFAAYPDVDWWAFSKRFLHSLHLKPLRHTAQINPHDDIARLSHLMVEINGILQDMCLDVWLYISRNVLCQKPKEGEVGSSTMPHKVNPIDWEKAEGNLGVSTALFEFFARKLPISRMQRDLSDSTVQRNLGMAFGFHLLSLKSMLKGLGKLDVNPSQCQAEIDTNPGVHGEAIQTVMRRYGYTDAYEQIKDLTRGKEVTASLLIGFVNGLTKVPLPIRKQLIKRIEGKE